ncbi:MULTISPECIES: glycine oxidase ThiO [Caldilinea]|uniref:glycine oxidase n=1 Tax=Caldilinea aerophila (strain DSM 14535 / JCM 11387 / NBRC 104270 / STL-6-O1) TaxID=926550 RepID=I0I505_CALAS|nr:MULTISPECIES: glycine oxidase ThiO [Caldilinea]BAM00343.1 glycine oxidase ThiO [Caldilinea aerophila DSM 14535 = NBRC 104270]GIV71698.1 MAG: glycine oxidase ThiO [Caldilinea sp.]
MKNKQFNSVLIVGGGVCGLGIGWRLAQANRPTTVLEQREVGPNSLPAATWASAGMLAPHVEAEPGEERLLPLLLESHARWPAFTQELKEASGVDVGYRTEGTLVVALDRDQVERLRFQYEFQRKLGLELTWLSGDAARQREPHLSRNVIAALYSPHDHQVDNRQVLLALRQAFLAAGGTLREHASVAEILVEKGEVQGVRLISGEILHAPVVVVAAGAWSATLPGLPPEARPPVRPVKGQMLALQTPLDAPLLRHVVWGRDVYLVPRKDGRLLVGATVEEKGFDAQLTAGGVYTLLRRAWEILPGIDEAPIVEMWAGLRPGSRDDAPILGATPVKGLILATGHYRNGILLAPITADAISHLILTGETPESIRNFGIGRFHR